MRDEVFVGAAVGLGLADPLGDELIAVEVKPDFVAVNGDAIGDGGGLQRMEADRRCWYGDRRSGHRLDGGLTCPGLLLPCHRAIEHEGGLDAGDAFSGSEVNPVAAICTGDDLLWFEPLRRRVVLAVMTPGHLIGKLTITITGSAADVAGRPS